MKLWLDDLRKPPWGYDLWAKSYDECIEILGRHAGRVEPVERIEYISLDHDLHPEHYAVGVMTARAGRIPRESFTHKTGFDVLVWMHKQGAWVPEISIHTLSELGRRDMIRYLVDYAPADVHWRACPTCAHVIDQYTCEGCGRLLRAYGVPRHDRERWSCADCAVPECTVATLDEKRP